MSRSDLINIALNASVTFSSKSQWSRSDDSREILTAEHNRDFSFHTDCIICLDTNVGVKQIAISLP